MSLPGVSGGVCIKLKSYDHHDVDRAAKQIVSKVKEFGVGVVSVIPLPTKRIVCTINRSPHVNKESREQFERREFCRLVYIKELVAGLVSYLNGVSLSAGVGVDIKLV